MTPQGWHFAAKLLLALLACPAVTPLLRAQSDMPGAPAGRVEAGVPSFAVFGPEAIGLSAQPTGMHLLPDGRVLVTSQHELAFGDGVRWETYRSAPGQPPNFRDCAVDERGRIYFGIESGIGRVEIGADGLWRTRQAVALPDDPRGGRRTMVGVVEAGGEWYWHATSGTLVRWRPGETPTTVPAHWTVETVFQQGRDLFLSEQSSGGLFCLTRGGERVTSVPELTSELITATVPFSGSTVLVGTTLSGLKLFDGTTFTPFGAPGPLRSGLRINDLCAVGDGDFAAAIDTLGLVFFDRTGKVLQVLESGLDHRLGRAEKLCYASDGVLWVLLNEGVARVEFPSRLSRFEPLIASSLSFAAPFRHTGNLWLLADGRTLRGDYDESGRLQRFTVENPPGQFAFTLDQIGDQLFAGTDVGIFERVGQAWKPIAPGVVNARLGFGHTPDGAIAYAARGEIGTLRPTVDGYTLNRIRVPALADNYNAYRDREGTVWLELGNGHVGRLDLSGREPALRIFGPEAGLADGWVAIFILDGEANFQLPGHLLRFDAATSRFVENDALLRRYPQFRSASTRPHTDTHGRVWYGSQGHVWTIDVTKPDAAPVDVPLPFVPTGFKFEDDGVVWLLGNRRLERYDQRIPEPPAARPRALVTSLQLPNSNRMLFDPTAIPALPYADNTVIFRFGAPGNPFSTPTTFEVLLTGAGNHWVSTGNTGQAIFNRLKEGRYTFRVRAVTPSGASSPEAQVAFVIQPPWFRTTIAWIAYAVGGISVLAFSVWYPAFRQRRENDRLERLVTNRTEQLHAMNAQLGRQIAETTEKSKELSASEERYRLLSSELEHRVFQRTAELSTSNRELQQRESLFRLIFEHAPVGISWSRADLDQVHHFNSTYRRILNLSVETLPDYTTLLQLVHPDDAAQQLEAVERINAGHLDSYRTDTRFILKDGRIVWGSLCLAVVRDESGRIVQEIGILEDISARKQAEQQLATTYKELLDASRMAGMAEVATGVLHNVGNVLNSLNVSSNLISTHLHQSKVDSLKKLSALLHERAADLGDFLTKDPKGRLVPELLEKLAQTAAAERDWFVQEMGSMQKNIDHIKDIVAMQQSYATVIGVSETLEAESLFEDALRMNTAALARHDVHVVREFLPVPKVSVEKGKVLQILINVIRNAKYACDDGQQYGVRDKVITVRIEPSAEGRVRFIVRDNGIGIAPENLTRIFAHGFTTRAYGHGFGLHSSALAAKEMKGSLTASSEGLGKGATFILEIPGETNPANEGTAPGVATTAT